MTKVGRPFKKGKPSEPRKGQKIPFCPLDLRPRMISFPFAKINLGLHILEKRSDGFHNLETCFYPVPSLCDVLEMMPAAKNEPAELKVLGMPWNESPEKNLVWKAWRLFQENEPNCPDFHWIILKKIPTGGGLGGGSSDAAFALQMLATYCHWSPSDARLHQMAASLGSDCAYFLNEKPMIGRGRGEILEPVSLDLSAYTIKFDFPGIHVSTALAFAGISPGPPKIPLAEVLKMPVTSWKEHLVNDFEASVFSRFPELKQRKENFYRQGAVYAAMSGSGSTLFGIFQKQEMVSVFQ